MAIPDYFTRAAIDDATFKATRFAADVETRLKTRIAELEARVDALERAARALR